MGEAASDELRQRRPVVGAPPSRRRRRGWSPTAPPRTLSFRRLDSAALIAPGPHLLVNGSVRRRPIPTDNGWRVRPSRPTIACRGREGVREIRPPRAADRPVRLGRRNVQWCAWPASTRYAADRGTPDSSVAQDARAPKWRLQNESHASRSWPGIPTWPPGLMCIVFSVEPKASNRASP